MSEYALAEREVELSVTSKRKAIPIRVGADDVAYADEAHATFIARACNAHFELCDVLTEQTRLTELANSIQHAGNKIPADIWSELYAVNQRARRVLSKVSGDAQWTERLASANKERNHDR